MIKGDRNKTQLPYKQINHTCKFNTSRPNTVKAALSPNSKIKQIGHFILGDTIGSGTFGVVKIGTHCLTNEKVAVKCLDKIRILEEINKTRFEREIKILKMLHHRNIVQLYSVIQNSTTIYLVMEYAEGEELFDYINNKKKLSEIEACKFYQQLISGIEYLSKVRVVHRDLKPENLLLDHKHTLKIVDFGLSNVYPNNNDGLLTTACGSPCYAAPEMILGKQYSGVSVDIWSSGIVLYAMLCGYLPFEEKNNDVLYKKITKGEFVTPFSLSDSAKNIIRKILNVNPERRLTIAEIKAHEWFNIVNPRPNLSEGLLIDKIIIPIDEDIIQEMELFGYNKNDVRSNLLYNKHNHITTTYYLILKQKIRSCIPSNADLKSNLFKEYISNETNHLKTYDYNIEVIIEKINNEVNENEIKNKEQQLNALTLCDNEVTDNTNNTTKNSVFQKNSRKGQKSISLKHNQTNNNNNNITLSFEPNMFYSYQQTQEVTTPNLTTLNDNNKIKNNEYVINKKIPKQYITCLHNKNVEERKEFYSKIINEHESSKDLGVNNKKKNRSAIVTSTNSKRNSKECIINVGKKTRLNNSMIVDKSKNDIKKDTNKKSIDSNNKTTKLNMYNNNNVHKHKVNSLKHKIKPLTSINKNNKLNLPQHLTQINQNKITHYNKNETCTEANINHIEIQNQTLHRVTSIECKKEKHISMSTKVRKSKELHNEDLLSGKLICTSLHKQKNNTSLNNSHHSNNKKILNNNNSISINETNNQTVIQNNIKLTSRVVPYYNSVKNKKNSSLPRPNVLINKSRQNSSINLNTETQKYYDYRRKKLFNTTVNFEKGIQNNSSIDKIKGHNNKTNVRIENEKNNKRNSSEKKKNELVKGDKDNLTNNSCNTIDNMEDIKKDVEVDVSKDVCNNEINNDIDNNIQIVDLQCLMTKDLNHIKGNLQKILNLLKIKYIWDKKSKFICEKFPIKFEININCNYEVNNCYSILYNKNISGPISNYRSILEIILDKINC